MATDFSMHDFSHPRSKMVLENYSINTILGSNMVQISSSEVNINDGVESFEFHGNVRIK